MVRLIEDFEEGCVSNAEAKPHEVLQHLLEARELRRKDLLLLFSARRARAAVRIT
jgi:hypothetical protein